MLTSFSRKNLTSPSSESLIPSDLRSPMSPFSTAMKTDLKWLMSEEGKCREEPKSSMVWDSGTSDRCER